MFFGGKFITLTKKTGGIRPITIGITWRRLTAKCAAAYACDKVKDILAPCQVGVGVKGGCEAGFHATRRFTNQMPPDYVVVKLDFANAFNCLDRDHMLQQVAIQIPEIYKFCYLVYHQASTLQFGTYSIWSKVGPQQGDSLGGLLFCLGIQPILSAAKSDLTLGYMDDVTLGGPLDRVSTDVDMFRMEGAAIGLMLNEDKCEIISRRPVMSELTRRFKRVEVEEALRWTLRSKAETPIYAGL